MSTRRLIRNASRQAQTRFTMKARAFIRALGEACRGTHFRGIWSLIMILALLTIVPSAQAAFVIASTDAGLVRGTVSDDGKVDVFQGLPYASPPVGNFRWAPPQPVVPWSGIRNALTPGSPCPQTGRLASINEDCLYLNVWGPHNEEAEGRPHGRLPVIVWIHGGGQVSTTGSEYDGSRLVTRGQPVIAVTINYRLNIFAFFAHAGLTAEIPDLGSGNYATLDQQYALRWVRKNIANFGGDPDNITIAGESGGAQAVCILLASPPAAGLFQRAISESGPCQWQYYPTRTASEARGAQIAVELGCTQTENADVVACLRDQPTATILAKFSGLGPTAQPAVGGGAFPLPLRHAIAFGRFNMVPIIQGANKDENLFFVAPAYDGRGTPVTQAQYPQIIEQIFGAERTPAILEQYPTSNYRTPSYALTAVLTDSAENGTASRNRIGSCNTHLGNQLLASWVPVYAFEFADENAPFPIPLFPLPTGGMRGAGHTTELPYLWKMNVTLNPAQQRLSDTMIGYWTTFAARGNPNAEGLPTWPRYTNSDQQVISLKPDATSANSNFGEEHKCKFWSEQGFDNLYGPYQTP
jgi:para-nitrobenzyl esterase